MSLKPPSLQMLAGLAAVKAKIKPTDLTTSDYQDKTKTLVTEACKDTIEFLSQEYPLNVRSDSRYTEELKSKYINTLAAFNIKKDTAFHFTAKWRRVDAINALLQDLNTEEGIAILQVQDEYGNTALHNAASFGGVDTINALLRGLNNEDRFTLLQTKDNEGYTALHKVDRNRSIDIINVLLRGLNNDKRVTLLQIQNKYGWTVLHEAARWGSAEEINALLEDLTNEEKKELFQIQNSEGQTPLDLANAEIKEAFRE